MLKDISIDDGFGGLGGLFESLLGEVNTINDHHNPLFSFKGTTCDNADCPYQFAIDYVLTDGVSDYSRRFNFGFVFIETDICWKLE